MPLPNNALVLVTDGRKTLFFRNQGDENQIDLRTEAFEEREDAPDRDIKTDAAGSSKQSNGFGRPALGETDFHQLEEDRWAHNAAETVNKRVLTNDFDALAIIAPPKTLGVLRKKLHKEAERRIVCQLPKEMTKRPIPDIEALIVGEMRAEAPADF
ncbi:host attachment family protein [Sphingomonas sp. NSE70-1]|uniref:Host attachment family protein n=1 Tax=Sphingomonas caseinilyticus TaxID=2908205 RepID=A0ABT0RRJ5_9SPHN|nr:host attachment family protein [Sphingomonas caseinilyticus]MCL6697544.1 host attachment family protein [Sphingomonas caseinilyticus]